MSRKIGISTLTDKELKKISLDLQVKQEPSKYAFNAAPNIICLFEQDNDDLYVPFSYKEKYPRPERKCFTQKEGIFKKQYPLREAQKEVRKEAIELLNAHGAAIIASYPGFGKTCLGINIACKLGMKTLIICNRIQLIKQWKESIERFTSGCKTHTVTTPAVSKSVILPDAHFYIINAGNIQKFPRSSFSDIGVVIVDECHMIMAEKLSHCMRNLTPRYLLGLSATPYRNDGLNILLDIYFGKKKIERKLFRKHTVYRVDTGFEPEIQLNKMGKVDWNSVLEAQCNNPKRNDLIIRIIQKFADRVFLVLCKRVDQAKYITQKLKELGEDVTSLIGSNQVYEQKSRVLVGTVGKCAVGFDHPRLNAMILASDAEQYFVQYLGRVFRCEDTVPVIFDILDKYSLLQKHFNTRKSVYIEHGGVVKSFTAEFPEFDMSM